MPHGLYYKALLAHARKASLFVSAIICSVVTFFGAVNSFSIDNQVHAPFILFSPIIFSSRFYKSELDIVIVCVLVGNAETRRPKIA